MEITQRACFHQCLYTKEPREVITMVKTIAQAHLLVKKVKACTIFHSDQVEHTSLWEHVDLPDKQAGETGWEQKMGAVWTWKTRLPAEYPNDIFYGKIKRAWPY
jgi:hypothetical protein